jgi:Gpi18-like mannosyltransferase
MNAMQRLKSPLSQAGIRQPLILFLIVRCFLSLWAVLTLTLNPLPAQPEETLRPYLGEFPLTEGAAGLLLGPWQRFDTLHYLRIARQGYTVDDSVFPPLYPLAIRALGGLLTLGAPPTAASAARLLAGLIWSNLACLGSLILLHRMAAAELGAASARRTLVYLVLFPAGFFLFSAYTEPIFLLFALGSVWAARRGQPWAAGILGLLAALTRLTGWTLVVPLAYEYLRQRDLNLRRLDWAAPAALLPPLGLAAFLGWRQWTGLPPIAWVYAEYWRQQAGWPWADLLAAVETILNGQATFVLVFNLVCAGLLIAATLAVFRRLPPVYGLYMAALLVFTLVTSSQGRPLNALSRYTVVFFPTFMLLGQLGQRPWVNRLILYPSLALFLYFSGQFFVWGWVA